jgi:hypothetical protein
VRDQILRRSSRGRRVKSVIVGDEPDVETNGESEVGFRFEEDGKGERCGAS